MSEHRKTPDNVIESYPAKRSRQGTDGPNPSGDGGNNRISRREILQALAPCFGWLGWTLPKASRESQVPKRTLERELINIARPAYDRERRRAA